MRWGEEHGDGACIVRFCSGGMGRGTLEIVCALEGSVAMGLEEEHGDGVCMRRFCSGGMGRKTWKWIVYARVLWR